MKRSRSLAVSSLLAAAWCLGLAALAMGQPSTALSRKSPDSAEIQSRAQASGLIRVIVQYRPPAGPARAALGTSAESIPAIAAENHAAQDAILSDRVGPPATALAGRGLTRMDLTPAFAFEATVAELDALAEDDRVVTIVVDRLADALLNQAVPLIGMANAYAAGATGAGWVVAVMDTGVETSHTFLTGKTIAEACFSTTTGTLGSGGSVSVCPGGASSSTAPGSGAACNIEWEPCEHGTHAAGIAVGLNSAWQSGQPLNGVARNARLIALQVFSQMSGADCADNGLSSPCVRAWASDIIRAFDHVYAIRNGLSDGTRVAAVSVSIGLGLFSPPHCDGLGLSRAINWLRDAGIATIAGAGNAGSRSQIVWPACASSAIAVAASSKTDVIASYTNISTQVAVLAPGGDGPMGSPEMILSSVPPGLDEVAPGFCGYSGPVPASGGSYCHISGTSMATPMVSGAWAAIKSVCPTASIDAILGALIATGTPITDTRDGGTVTKNRIRVDAALQQLGCDVAAPPITSPAPGTTLAATTVTFTGGHTGADLQHFLHVGTLQGGNDIASLDLGTGHTVEVNLPASTAGTTIWVRYWTRFPAGWFLTDQQYPVVTFIADVPPNHAFSAWIQALIEAGITGGCATSPLRYCPDAVVTRAQMAVFLLRGIHGAGYAPPSATGRFDDVPVTGPNPHPLGNWIEQLAQEGITAGCSASPPRYCPEDSVTRGQMAVFLLRAKHGAAYQPPEATGLFDDVPVTGPTPHPLRNWIEQLAREGITAGCSASPPRYCPDAPVTRAQMAVFLVRAFNLPL
jgi:serine protease